LEQAAVISAASILAVWIAYPAVMASLAALKRQRRPQRPLPVDAGEHHERPTVSVIIATRDDVKSVHERVADCLRAADDSVAVEVIVGLDAARPADDGTEDRAELPALSPNVTFVAGDEPGGKAATLNAAVREAHGDVLLFTDVHQRFERNAIAQLASVFSDDRVGAASGRLELSAGAQRSLAGRYWSWERRLRRSEAEVHSCVGATGAIWALRRTLWAPLPEQLILDDVYTPMRVVLGGHRVTFVDGARAVDLRSPTRGHEYRRKVRTLTGVVQLCAWLPEVLQPRRNPIWLQFVFHKLLRLLTPYWLIGTATWGAAAGARLAARNRSTRTASAVALAGLCLAGKSRLLRLAADTLTWVVTLQAAAVVAAKNGAQQRWDVWRPQ